MSQTVTSSLEISLMFEDGDIRTYKIPDVDISQPGLIKQRAKSINEETGAGATYATAMKSTFVSETGARMLNVAGVTTISRVEEVIYSG